MPKGIGYPKEPKMYIIPSRSYGISADEAASLLVTAEEIKMNKPLHKVAITSLKKKKKAEEKVLK
jgi:hypothetical protein